MSLLRWVLKNEVDELVKEGLRVEFVGSRDGVDKDIIELIDSVEEKTKDFTSGTLAICFNYGGHLEIVDAVNGALADGEKITVQSIAKHLYKPHIPPCDLIIRTSGEQRLSNFMLWRAEYAEFAFTKTLWPDFKGDELTDIVDGYLGRERRYGQ